MLLARHAQGSAQPSSGHAGQGRTCIKDWPGSGSLSVGCGRPGSWYDAAALSGVCVIVRSHIRLRVRQRCRRPRRPCARGFFGLLVGAVSAGRRRYAQASHASLQDVCLSWTADPDARPVRHASPTWRDVRKRKRTRCERRPCAEDTVCPRRSAVAPFFAHPTSGLLVCTCPGALGSRYLTAPLSSEIRCITLPTSPVV